MKKPFNETRIGKILLNPMIKGLIKSIPIAGEMADNILDETEESSAGSVNKKALAPQLIRLGIYVVLLYLALRGAISWEEAETGKEFIQP